MTKQEWTEASARVKAYQSYEYELDKIDGLLKNIRSYTSFTVNTQTSAGNVNIGIDSTIREDLVELIQKYRERIATAMTEV